MKIETIKLWHDRDDVELTTFIHMRDAFIPNPVKKPAVIVCPGGAYMECPRHGNEGDPVAMTFAMDGYQSFVLEYSVGKKAPEGKALFPAQLLDLGKTILTIRENAEEWCIDVDRISIIGFSAGAHLCGMFATTYHQALLSDYFKVESWVFKPLCAMLIYGLMDFVLQEAYNEKHKNPMLPQNINVTTFGVEHPEKGQLQVFSPIQHVSEHTPPIFLAAAIDDDLVPSLHSLKMAEKLHLQGVPYELHMFRFGAHGFSLGRNLFEPFRDDKVHACAKWIPMAKTFLMHLIAPEAMEWEKNPFANLGQ